jgi:2'-5' RNA ligase
MRLFIAVDVNEAVRRQLALVQKQLRERLGGAGIKWVNPDLIHLTLKFLGEVPDQDVPRVCRVVQEAANRHSPFEIRVHGIGTFGKPARVLWVGVLESEKLAALASDLETSFEAAGWPREAKGFSAHLTLARIREPRSGSAAQRAVQEQPPRSFGEVWIDQVVVYESRLSSKGPVYTAAGRYDLNG